MKVQIDVTHKYSPVSVYRNEAMAEQLQEYVDDILLWAMEVDMPAEYYKLVFSSDNILATRSRRRIYGDEKVWAVFSVDAADLFMFTLKWGALQHKG